MSSSSIAVLMPNYNGGLWLENACRHILTQSMPPGQMIVVDDGSTDNSRELLLNLKAIYPHLELVFLEKNKGVLEAVQIGLEKVNCPFVTFSAVDDIILPGFFEKMENMIQKKPDCSVVLCRNVFYLDKTDWAWAESPAWTSETRWVSPDEIVRIGQKKLFNVSGNSAVYNKEQLFKYGGFKSALGFSADSFLLLKILLSEGCGYVPELLTLLRLRSDSFSAVSTKNKTVSGKIAEIILDEIEASDEIFKQRLKKSALLARSSVLFFKGFYKRKPLKDFRTSRFYQNMIYERFLMIMERFLGPKKFHFWMRFFGKRIIYQKNDLRKIL